MRTLLLGLAAPFAALALTPTTAADAHGSGGPSEHWKGDDHGDFDRDRRDRHDRHDRFDRRRFNGFVFIDDDRDWQGDSAQRHDSFNDWWHERPWRAYPAWVRNNQRCERLWWSGGGWRC